MSGHGGNIYAASRRTGIPEEQILDFSASINPLGMPEGAARAIRDGIGRLYHYPEPYSEELASCVARHLAVDPETVICGNGSTELIYLVPRALHPRRVLIPNPTFMEYGRACSLAGVSGVVAMQLRDDVRFDVFPGDFIDLMGGSEPCDMAFLCNPNNPTGRLVSREDVLECADAARRRGCYLVVDEAFADFCPEASVCGDVEKNPYLIVLRSMTKFYALSGLRIGCAVLHPSIAEKARAYKEPWTVNSLAQKAGIAALGDGAVQRGHSECHGRGKDLHGTGVDEDRHTFRSLQGELLPHPPKGRTGSEGHSGRQRDSGKRLFRFSGPRRDISEDCSPFEKRKHKAPAGDG